MSPLATICSRCQQTTLNATNGRCPDCQTDHSREDGARRRQHPRHRIYSNPQWRQTARTVLNRDHWTCIDCHRHQTQLNPGERLTADHSPIPVLECTDPYNPDTCQTRCTTCHGHKDGKRAHQ